MMNPNLFSTVVGFLFIAVCTASVPDDHVEDKDLNLLARGTVKVSVKANDVKTLTVEGVHKPLSCRSGP